jgi:hypothetical protein
MGHSTALWRTARVGFDLGLIACATVLGAGGGGRLALRFYAFPDRQ